MKCRNPFIKDGMAYGCGQCMPCRVNKRRIWSFRIVLESMMYENNVMLSLTYDDEHLPRSEDGRGILVSKDMQDFLKRYRKAVEPERIRYFGCGEYGDDSWRPHFHIIVFNGQNCVYGQTRPSRVSKGCCAVCDSVRRIWGKGNVFLNEVNEKTAQYTCGYVTKKMVDKEDYRLKGLPPEFARMSLKPGIGRDMMWEVASSLMQFNLVDTQVDVPSTLRMGNRIFPIGRYLQNNLRLMVGKDAKAPEEVIKRLQAELQPLRTAAFENSRSFKKEVVQAGDQAVKNMEVRQNIHRQRKGKL